VAVGMHINWNINNLKKETQMKIIKGETDFFQRKSFWFILVILLYTACVYPPFVLMTEAGITAGRKWNWIFTLLPTPYEVPEIDLVMLFVEVIIAFLLALGVSLILFGIEKVCKAKGSTR
jgi:hypothetical protein